MVRWLLSVLSAGLAVIVVAPMAFAETDSVRFDFDASDPNAVHTWTTPDGVTEITVEAAGGGGGGAQNTASGVEAEWSGGAGALVEATVTTSGGEAFTIGVGGWGSGYRNVGGGGGGGGASILTGSNSMIIAGGGGGAGVSGDGGAAGGTNGRGGNGSPTGSLQAFGKGASGGTGAHTANVPLNGMFDYKGRDFVSGDATLDGRGFGGARVGGAGSAFTSLNYGGLGGAGYGGGAAGTYGGRGYSRGGGAGGSTAQGSAVDADSITYSAGGGSGGFGATRGQAGWVIITWTVPVRRTVEANSPREVRGEAPIYSVSLRAPAGMSCASAQETSDGAWVRLPSAAECAPVAQAPTPMSGSSGGMSPSAEPLLLGWATIPDFPVELAQRQVANGWGAYELTDENGQLTAVFIPAGNWAALAGDAQFFPVWSE